MEWQVLQLNAALAAILPCAEFLAQPALMSSELRSLAVLDKWGKCLVQRAICRPAVSNPLFFQAALPPPWLRSFRGLPLLSAKITTLRNDARRIGTSIAIYPQTQRQ